VLDRQAWEYIHRGQLLGRDGQVRGLDKVLIYLVIRIVWTFERHIFCWSIYTTDIMNRHSISGNNAEQVLQLQISDLHNNLVVMGTNVGAGPGALNQVTTGNVMVGASAGYVCSGGSNNTFLASNTAFKPGVGYYNGSIAFGTGAVITNYNQLMVATNVTQAYTGYPSWNLYQNGTVVTLIEQASNGAQWLTSVGLFITPAKAGNTFQWKFQFSSGKQPWLLLARVDDSPWVHCIIEATTVDNCEVLSQARGPIYDRERLQG